MSKILYATFFVTLLKFSVSTITAMLYINLFCNNKRYTLIGGLLYTFSGFTIVNTNFYFFLDVIAIFPLMLYGLELVLANEKKYIYVIAVCINAFINIYFFVSSCILIVVYTFFRIKVYKVSKLKENIRIIMRIAILSILGMGLAGISLTPSFLAILRSGKAVDSLGSQIGLMYWPQNILERIRIFLSPIESGRYHAFFDCSSWSSTACYLPIFGSFLVIQGCLTRKNWIRNISIFLSICLFIPFLNAAFNLFTSTDYTRWLYGLVLIFSLVTVLSLEELEKGTFIVNKRLLFIYTSFTFCILLVPVIIYVLYNYGVVLVNKFVSANQSDYYIGLSKTIPILILTVLNFVGLGIIFSKKCKSNIIVLIVGVGCCLNYFVYNSINYDMNITGYNNEYYYQKAMVEGNDENSNNFSYRIDYPNQILNYGLFKGMPAVKYYNSLQNPNSSYFAAAVGLADNMADTTIESSIIKNKYIDTLLSVKYFYDYNQNEKISDSFIYVNEKNGVKVYENKDFISMGFVYDDYCTEEELNDAAEEMRTYKMLDSLIIKETDQQIINKYLTHDITIKDSEELSTIISERKNNTALYFRGTSTGFSSKINLKENNIVFYSIPYDVGWNIKVNGEPAKVYEVNYGLMGIYCEAGENDISATYITPGLREGFFISLFFGCIGIILMIKKQFTKSH